MIRPFLAALFALPLAACGGAADTATTPIAVSAIGAGAEPGDPSMGPLDTPSRALMDATAQGLVRFDATGQIEPGLAERWIVIDDGRSYIFRLREADWSNGEPVTAEEVVRVLRRAAAARSRNALAPFLAVIDEIVEMTPQVIEVRLKRPRPDLLKLFAQPEMAVFRPGATGSGPFRARRDPDGAIRLTPAPDPNAPADADAAPRPRGTAVRLRGERAALAVARFQEGEADLVLGGGFTDWPILAAAGVPMATVQVDPALGLFGFAVIRRDGFLADPANRAALAMVIDRPALLAAFRPGWTPVETLLPAQLDSAAAPAQPFWAPLPLEARRENARNQLRTWQRAHAGPVVIRLALPAGPGANIVWSQVGRALLAAGFQPRRVGIADEAELRLVDAVAPYDSARWVIATACQLCSDDAATLAAAARDAPTLDARAHRIAEADAMLTADAAYIPIAQPLRWAIVTARVTGWQGNTRAWHPLNHLRNEGE